MPSTSILFRWSKTIVTALIGLMAALIAVDNLTDYQTNYLFVEHVMKMDTIFAASHVQYRSITSPSMYNITYILIIIIEIVMAVFCLKGSWEMFKNIRGDALVFHGSKNWAVAGILTGIVLWLFGFEVVGGEWFSMWQSTTSNGLAAAERVLGPLFLILILLHLRDE